MKKKIIPELDINKEIRNIGIVLIVLGIIHLFLQNVLSSMWGWALIVIGIFSLFYRSKNMILFLGILLIILGIWNISNSIMTLSPFWIMLGGFQIYWGIKEISRFNLIKENPKMKFNINKKQKEGRKYSILGILFAVLSLIVLPIVFGPLAIIFGVIAVLKGDIKWGIIAIVLGVVLAVVSILLAIYFLS